MRSMVEGASPRSRQANLPSSIHMIQRGASDAPSVTARIRAAPPPRLRRRGEDEPPLTG